jgi:hypothetical protein
MSTPRGLVASCGNLHLPCPESDQSACPASENYILIARPPCPTNGVHFRVQKLPKLPSSKNASAIGQALLALHSRIPAADIVTKWKEFNKPNPPPEYRNTPILLVQWLAREISHHFSIFDTTFVVEINKNLEAEARVEVSSSREIFIEYSGRKSVCSAELIATLAHEIAHIFLDRLDLRFSDKLENEVLTDTATIYLGFADHYLDSQWDSEENIGSYQVKQSFRLGYLSVDEIGYIAARRDRLLGTNTLKKLRTDIGRAAYSRGRKLLQLELAKRPYRPRSLLDRPMYKLGWVKATEGAHLVFDCCICRMAIRIANQRKCVVVTCPNCTGKFKCYS